MSDFKKWKDRYEKHWCTDEQLQRLVQLKVLTVNEDKDEYQMITGKPYNA